jgi:uncharacterized protein YdhG (YjbR/CyaY superfamily)
MTAIDAALRKVEPRKRAHLERIRKIAKAIVPDAEETISYRIPTLKYRGKPFLGFAAFAQHVGIFPFGGREIAVLKDELSAYSLSKGTIRVPYDKPITKSLLSKIIRRKLKAIDETLKAAQR